MAFPQTPLDVTIELYYDLAWQDITSYVYHRDAAPITITRGYTANSKNCDPGKLKCELNNRDARFSPRNPTSPLYGKIGRNTPIRVSATYSAVTYVRFVGEVVSWPSRWDVSGKDVWVPLDAYGILRRLNKGEKPIQPSLNLTVLADSPVHYWRMDDPEGSTYAAPSVPNGTVNLQVDALSTIGWAELVAPPGGETAAPRLNEGFLEATLTDVTAPWTVEYAVLRPDDGSLDGQVIAFLAFLVDGLPTSINTTIAEDADVSVRDWYHYKFTGTQNGASYEIRYWRNGIDKGIGSTAAGTLGALTRLAIGGANVAGDWGASYLAVYLGTSVDAEEHSDALQAFAGERAHERFERLCTQTGVPFATVGETSQEMSAQRAVPLLESLRDAEAADQGLLSERRDALGLKFRTNASRYNQTPIAFDYTAGHISPPFDPEPDDQAVFNDREVKGRLGGYYRSELPTGALSVQDPPDGIGRYDDTITVDIYDPAQAQGIAAWRLHVGTWDAERYPSVRVDLSAPGNNTLIPDITTADTGDLITISNLPIWLPPGDAELAIAGYTEKIAFFDWNFTFACWPGGPYNVVGAWGLLAHELHTAMNTSVTTADIATTSADQPLLATSGIGAGYGITVGAEDLTVTAVAASLVTFGAAGTVTHASNASVTPGIPASVATGNLLLAFAAIRNSGTGVPDTPSGYTRLPVFPSNANCQLFAKIATSGAEAAPAITFTGGVANADTSAQMIRLPGKWHSTANLIPARGSAVRLNSSAQNITYPALSKPEADNCIILYLGWKQDDWTSVDAIAGATEIGEPDTTTGDDHGIVWDYVIQTTAAAIPAGVFTVTGGATAISRAAVVALRCDYQTATVTRSVNGVSASHSAADAVTATRPMRWGLI